MPVDQRAGTATSATIGAATTSGDAAAITAALGAARCGVPPPRPAPASRARPSDTYPPTCSAKPRELGRDDVLRRRAGADLLERLEVLERHRLLVDLRRGREDPLQRLAEALGAEDRGLPLALGLEDLGLLLALGDVDRGLPGALGLGDHGASGPLGRQLPVHRVLDVARRRDLADLDRRDLAAPALGDLVQLDPQDLVDLLALGQHVVEQDVADDGPQRGGRHALERARRSC